MATPVAADQWHLYIAYNRAASDEGDPRVRKRLSIPLPPGARKTLSIEDVHGAGLVALGGDGPASTWIGFYSEWFGTRNWRASGDWQGSAGAWRRRFVGEGEPGWIVDIEIMPAARRAPGQDVAVDKQGPRVGEIAERHPGAGRVAAFLSIAPSGAVAEK
jgi:hypothetical protein